MEWVRLGRLDATRGCMLWVTGGKLSRILYNACPNAQKHSIVLLRRFYAGFVLDLTQEPNLEPY